MEADPPAAPPSETHLSWEDLALLAANWRVPACRAEVLA